MENPVKVLVLVTDPWRTDTSGGNTIDNFFSGMGNVEFAHLYCSDGMPDNTVCDRYFQISQTEVVKKFLFHKKVGHAFRWKRETEFKEEKKSKDGSVQIIINKFKIVRPQFLLTIRKLLWFYSNWKTKELKSFVLDFSPDVIYAPCYASPFQLALTRYVKEIAGCKVVTWSADDNYSLRQFSLSPFFWLNRFWDRRCLRKTYPYYDKFYSVSEDEIKELEPIVGKRMAILRKGVNVPNCYKGRELNNPLKFIYAGNLYCNRDRILLRIANALRKLNEESVKAELHIYTGSKLKAKLAERLNDGRSVYNHGLISPQELSEIYQHSDVAIHCESFGLKDRLATRLSFSTKIIDCFQSGCAILAIAWKEHTALKYLQKEDAAICIAEEDCIETAVIELANDRERIMDYMKKAYECEKRNHKIEDIQGKLYKDFVELSVK